MPIEFAKELNEEQLAAVQAPDGPVLVIAAAIVGLRREWPGRGDISRRTLLFLVLSGAATGLSWLCYYHALQLAPASKVAPVDKLSVVFAILLALLFLGESISWQIALGGTLITAGAIIIAVG